MLPPLLSTKFTMPMGVGWIAATAADAAPGSDAAEIAAAEEAADVDDGSMGAGRQRRRQIWFDFEPTSAILFMNFSTPALSTGCCRRVYCQQWGGGGSERGRKGGKWLAGHRRSREWWDREDWHTLGKFGFTAISAVGSDDSARKKGRSVLGSMLR